MKISKFIVAFTLLFTLASCSSRKNTLTYFKNMPDEGSVPVGAYNITIVPDDELVINVTSAEPEAAADYMIPYMRPRVNDFNTPNGQTPESNFITRRNSNLNYQTYRVDKDGFITFPVLGKIHVGGMSLPGLATYLTERIGEKVVEPLVTVELVNFHVNVTGEVARPGQQLVNRERYSVLDAIAEAGDLTQYGVRERVLLIRENNGQREYHRLDLSDKELLNSPYFYMQQNDVIYVEPNRVRQANARTDQERQFRLSMTSVIVSAVSVIASLAIALFIK